MQVEDVREPEEEPQPDVTAASVEQKTLMQSIGGQEIKDKLTELFTPNKLKPRTAPDAQLSAAPTEKKKERGHSGCLDWATCYMPRSRAEISEACRQAFTATCNLLMLLCPLHTERLPTHSDPSLFSYDNAVSRRYSLC